MGPLGKALPATLSRRGGGGERTGVRPLRPTKQAPAHCKPWGSLPGECAQGGGPSAGVGVPCSPPRSLPARPPATPERASGDCGAPAAALPVALRLHTERGRSHDGRSPPAPGAPHRARSDGAGLPAASRQASPAPPRPLEGRQAGAPRGTQRSPEASRGCPERAETSFPAQAVPAVHLTGSPRSSRDTSRSSAAGRCRSRQRSTDCSGAPLAISPPARNPRPAPLGRRERRLPGKGAPGQSGRSGGPARRGRNPSSLLQPCPPLTRQGLHVSRCGTSECVHAGPSSQPCTQVVPARDGKV